ncbi:MAG TPA: hypothetical protein EYH03_01075 [Chromatiales bacterium]|nr:hypothetical protein [Chromatiales bacterium]
MSDKHQSADDAYLTAFRGSFTSALRWHHLEALWGRLRDQADEGWYLYAVGERPPAKSADAEQVLAFIDKVDELLRREHDEDYCGIVYVDDLENPAMVKIYDPNNLGVSCGFSDNPPLPGWVMSKLPPCDLPEAQRPTNSRRRWWQALFGA